MDVYRNQGIPKDWGAIQLKKEQFEKYILKDEFTELVNCPEQKEELHYYLCEKAELYSKIRKHREKVKNS